MTLEERKRIIKNLRKYVKPYGYSIRYREGFYEGTDFTLELFKGYVVNVNRVWQSDFWRNSWADFEREVKSCYLYFDNYCKK